MGRIEFRSRLAAWDGSFPQCRLDAVDEATGESPERIQNPDVETILLAPFAVADVTLHWNQA